MLAADGGYGAESLMSTGRRGERGGKKKKEKEKKEETNT